METTIKNNYDAMDYMVELLNKVRNNDITQSEIQKAVAVANTSVRQAALQLRYNKQMGSDEKIPFLER